ncbi:transglutaminase-like cysteine peptidase [Devosia rhodophyticola]|uniref:Transglutaminase-like cysteine peptidase n=1 Tax=Devosia rhodophyticola TaxID=3026423 RepID=A0ABY7YWD1_9HYPH|nr:transglutaminase-like cysteine peptidase [Devosia rhodophyticola]WDR05497.1 transglutaminase-like cysteine peptidase [Devosia rhodophyticola]
MFNPTRFAAAIIGLVLGAFATTLPAAAIDTTNIAFVQTATQTTSIPVGAAEFCRTHPSECQPNSQVVAVEALTEARWNQLLAINALYNESVVAVTDQDLYQVAEFWTYPNGYGDCEDYALAKRRDLINAGWPASTLLIAVVRQTNGEGHAVLMARTDRGDLVLDNLDGTINVWNHTPYKFIKRQSQANPGQWVDMFDNRPIVVAALEK